jgi:hypothetical protein
MPRLLTPLAAALVLLATSASAASAKNCSFNATAAGNFGPTYVVPPIKAFGVTCSTAKRVVKAYQSCRKAHGGYKFGECPHSVSVLGFHCRDKKGRNALQTFGTATCTKGSRKVVHNWEQNVH